MRDKNDWLTSWGIFLGGVGLLMAGIGALFYAAQQHIVSRAVVRQMDGFASRLVSDIMATNGVDTVSVVDHDGRPWITIENRDKTGATFYRLDEDNEN